MTTLLYAQAPDVHYRHHGVAMSPGAIGSQQLQRGGPLAGYVQPVEIKAPDGALVSLAVAGDFSEPFAAPVNVGMLVAPVYRLRVTNIPRHEGFEVFPTVELVNRLYPPHGQARRFPIPIELTQEELELALDGKFVTRVIYLEDPEHALPVSEAGQDQNWFDAGPGADPLRTADQLGRPVAILRMGGRLPIHDAGPDTEFVGDCPPWTLIRPPTVFGPAEELPPPVAHRKSVVNWLSKLWKRMSK